jgi:hypothetical protein
VLAEGQAGFCVDSGEKYYPHVYIRPVPDIPVGNEAALSGWCKSWCEQVDPEKLVAMGTKDDGSITTCYCHFSADNLPSPFDVTRYKPAATILNAGFSGTGCGGAGGSTLFTCYRNCAYNQCVSIYACLS